MGRFTEEELSKIKSSIELDISYVKIDSVSSLISSINLLGQYFQYVFVSFTNGKFNSGTGVLESLKPNSVYCLFSKCRNCITHCKDSKILIQYITNLRKLLNSYTFRSSEFMKLPEVIRHSIIDLSNANLLWDDLLSMYESVNETESNTEIDSSMTGAEFEVNKSVWRESSVKEISKLYDKSLIESLMEFSRYEGDHEFNWGCHTGFYYIYGIQGKSNIPEVIYVKATTDDELKTESHFDNLRSNLEISTEEYSDRLDSMIILSFGNAKEEQCAVLVRLGKVYINDEDFEFNLYERDNYEDDEDDFLSGASFMVDI